MATVRLSQNIQYYVTEQINKLYRERIKRAYDKLNTLPLADSCYEFHISAEDRHRVELLNSSPAGIWVQKLVEIPIWIPSHMYTTRNTFCFPRPVPPFKQHAQGFKLVRGMPYFEEVEAILNEATEANKELQTLLSTLVANAFKQCTSLKQLLDLWPGALEFMPDEVKHKHAMKEEKRKKTTLAPISDEAKQMLIKARMLAAS